MVAEVNNTGGVMTTVALVVLPGSMESDTGVLQLISTSQLRKESYIALYWDAVYLRLRKLKYLR